MNILVCTCLPFRTPSIDRLHSLVAVDDRCQERGLVTSRQSSGDNRDSASDGRDSLDYLITSKCYLVKTLNSTILIRVNDKDIAMHVCMYVSLSSSLSLSFSLTLSLRASVYTHLRCTILTGILPECSNAKTRLVLKRQMNKTTRFRRQLNTRYII